MPHSPLGRFIWQELATTDPAAARDFYTRLFGWETQRFPGEEMEYTIWLNGGTGVGGMMKLPRAMRDAGVAPHWLGYVYTNDADATLARGNQLGGDVLAGPEQVSNVGRWAVLRDPQGAVFAALRPDGPVRPAAPPRIGDFSWHELATTDHEAAFAYYADLFGWERTGTFDMGAMGTYILLGAEGGTFGGMYRASPDYPAPPDWLHYVRVASADEAARRVVELGGVVLHGPVEVPGGDRIAQCRDPQGAAFAVHALAGDQS